MKLVALPIPLFLTLCLVAAVAVNSSSAVFLYLVFNFLIFFIFWSYKPSKDELDGHWSCLLSSSEDGEDACVKIKGENAESSCEVAGDTYVNIEGENHNNEKAQENANGKDNDDEKHSCSDASAGEIGWQDVDGEFDENLEKRIEDFIAKVNKGWREEMLRDQ